MHPLSAQKGLEFSFTAQGELMTVSKQLYLPWQIVIRMLIKRSNITAPFESHLNFKHHVTQ
jgi:hypothetical protein